MKAAENSLKHVGKIFDAHGLKGEIYVFVFSGDASWSLRLSEMTLKIQGKILQYKIEKVKLFKKGFIAKLAGVDSRNQSEDLKGAELWVDSNLFISAHGESIYLTEIQDFEIHDKILGNVGTIESFSSNGAQDLLQVRSSNGVYEIPFVKEFVINIDFEKKTVFTRLPEGLLEINNKEYE